MNKVIGLVIGRFDKKRLIAITLLMLLGLENSAFAAAYNSLDLRGVVASKTPNVVLQSGNIANSTIFTNSTSARVTTPTLNYPTSRNVVTGTFSSGTVPGSVNAIDSNYFIVLSTPTGTRTVATEFIFPVSSSTPTQLNFTIVEQYDVATVSVTIQVYNFTGGAYPTSGQGYFTYTSSGTAGTDETQTLTITTNPQFYASAGQAKVEITATLTAAQFNQKVNLVRLHYYISTLNYPTTASVLGGSYVSGAVPASINALDSSYFTVSSDAQGAKQIGKVTSADQTILPPSQQRVFRNTRGNAAYYTFYRATVSTVDKCWYSYSIDGATWTINQDTTLSANYASCSVTFREDRANARTVVYLVASKVSSVAANGDDIVFVIGTIADTAFALSWGTLQTISASAPSQNQAYPAIALAGDRFLHTVFAFSNNPSGTASDFQNAVECATTTTVSSFGTTNPTWNCSDPSLAQPWKDTAPNVDQPTSMPSILAGISGHDVMLIQGGCVTAESNPCTPSTTTPELYRWMDWDGSTRTWQSAFVQKVILGSPTADQRSATVNMTDGRIYYMFGNTTGIFSRTFASPYGSTSFTSDITVVTPGAAGLHLTISESGATKKVFAFYSRDVAPRGVFSKNTTMTNAWGSEQTEYTNATVGSRWVTTPTIFNNATGATYSFTTLPFVWAQAAATPELWFGAHTLSRLTETQFVFSFSSIVPSKLVFTVVHQYDAGSVSVTIEVWNFTANSWAASGEAGQLQYTSSSTPGTDEMKSLVVTSNPGSYISSGVVKVNVRGAGSGTYQQKSNLLGLDYGQTYDYVLKIVNQQATSYSIRLDSSTLTQSNMGRLVNFTAWFHDPTSSVQLQVIGGSFTTQTGSFYTLGPSATVFLTISLTASGPGVSTVDCFLRIYASGSSTQHADYRLTFKLS